MIRITTLFFTFLLGLFSLVAQQEYKNPIISADYSDPDVIRVDDDYFMVSSSFNMVPGLPILHSKDVVNWTIVSHAIDSLPDALFTYTNRDESTLDYKLPRPGKGVYAPCIRYHDDYFWVFWADPDAGAYMVKSKSASGPWSKPLLIQKAHGWIDTTPLWDESTGRAWLAHAYAKSRIGFNSKVAVAEMSWDATHLLSDDCVVFDAHNDTLAIDNRIHAVIEGCKFIKRHDYYYILCPAGGVDDGWQTALRATNPLGPYTSRVICEQGSTNVNGPHQGGLFDTPSGEWWFAHFQSTNVLGRIVWLEPASWVNDWPVIGVDSDNDGIGNPVLHYSTPVSLLDKNSQLQMSDDFLGDEIGLQWQWPANAGASYCKLDNGFLELYPYVNADLQLLNSPNVITQMFPSFDFDAVTELHLDHADGEEIRGGFAVMGRKCFDIALQYRNGESTIVVRHGDDIIDSRALKQKNVFFKVEAKGIHPLPLMSRGDVNRGDVQCQFLYSYDGVDFLPLGGVFEASPGAWIGARLGLFCQSVKPTSSKLRVDSIVVTLN